MIVIPRLPFRGLNAHAPVRIYRRHLPHWRQAGATYFITFRQADALPRPLLLQWAEERRTWFDAHGLTTSLDQAVREARYRAIPEEERRRFERDQIRKPLIELDRNHGSCLLGKREYANAVGDALRFYDGAKVQCGDFVIMPNHVHWIAMPLGDAEPEMLLYSVKRYSATQIGKTAPHGTSPFWQKESYDHLIRDQEELVRIRRYIEDNPVKAGLRGGEYIYHRADWL